MTAATNIDLNPATNLDVALSIARKARPVFPCSADKRPLVSSGFKAASTDERQIQTWWTTWPDALVGMPTGAASGIAVLDVDMETDAATGEVLKDGEGALQGFLKETGETIPVTVEVQTPRGGRHLYFRHQPGFRCSSSSAGIDVRADGGYVIAPGSRLPDGRSYGYLNPEGIFEVAEAPTALVPLLKTGKLQSGAVHSEVPSLIKTLGLVDSSGSSRRGDIERALVGFWDPNSYDDWSRAALALHAFPEGFNIWRAWAATSPKFDAGENLSKWQQTVPSRGITERSILARVPREILSDWGKGHVTRRVEPNRHDKPTEGTAPAEVKRRDFQSVWLDDVEIDGGTEWLVSHLLTSASMSALWGDPGCGKSFLAVHLAVCVSCGWEFLGYGTTQGGVIYIAAEGGRGVKKRLVAIRKQFGLSKGIPFVLIPTSVDLCTEDHETEDLISEILRLGSAMAFPLRLVVLDTLNRVMAGGNENDSQDMGALIRNGDRIRHETGAHLMFVHHGGKDRDRKTRGHSSFFGALDTAIEVTVSEVTGSRTAKVRKQKDGEDGGIFGFSLEQVTLEDDGVETVTSCIVAPVEATDSEEPPAPRKLTGVNALALDALRKAVEEHGSVPPSCAHIPKQTRAVSPDLWRRYFYQMRTSDTPEANKKAFKRAVIDLQNRDLASTWGEFSWLV